MVAPVALFSGGMDDLADPTDVSRLISELNPNVIVYEDEISYYSHMGLIYFEIEFINRIANNFHFNRFRLGIRCIHCFIPSNYFIIQFNALNL